MTSHLFRFSVMLSGLGLLEVLGTSVVICIDDRGQSTLLGLFGRYAPSLLSLFMAMSTELGYTGTIVPDS